MSAGAGATRSATTGSATIVAGGAVCWKMIDGTVSILLVHRTTHNDVSLPKGKVDPGETLPETAKREIREETGLEVTLGAYLGRVDYLVPSNKPKEVHYWACEVDPGEAERAPFESNDEIDALEWLSVKKALTRLTYTHDADIVNTFQALYDSGRLRTFPIILVRHGKAMPPEKWDGPDATRPLLHKGLLQAAGIAQGILAYGPERIVTSPSVRCLATIQPVKEATDMPLKISKGISQDAYTAQGTTPMKIMDKRIRKKVPTVLCSHGPVLPQLVSAASRYGHQSENTFSRAAHLRVGSFSVLHFSKDTETPQIVAIETHEAPATEK
jgi:8-oxo-dGTP diphosphatase